MLVQLNATTRPGEDAIALLLDCHERIRRFSAMALKLAFAVNEDPTVLRDAAARVHRYFSVALPLHVEDEEQSIRARLEANASEAVRAALEKMSGEHGRIDGLLAELLPIWDAVQRDATQLAQHQEWLQWATRSFEHLMVEHLKLEETAIFPTLRQSLAPEELDAIKREMKARRDSGVTTR